MDDSETSREGVGIALSNFCDLGRVGRVATKKLGVVTNRRQKLPDETLSLGFARPTASGRHEYEKK
jgi:hypothetical protein